MPAGAGPRTCGPVWFMRQAGRYMKQYREIRAKHGILEICKRPDLAATVTLQPVEMLDVDAAIIFADLLLPVEPMGLKLKFVDGRRAGDRQPGAHLRRRRFAFHLQHRRSRLRGRGHPARWCARWPARCR